ncbi:hypothetical protein, partial [Nostoc sp. NOS(2021)]|uniref:hypothetical protein n=1 Tax=Nostoc sp. NOS(2021) TaxID=2815407 RepID=UPI0025EF1812
MVETTKYHAMCDLFLETRFHSSPSSGYRVYTSLLELLHRFSNQKPNPPAPSLLALGKPNSPLRFGYPLVTSFLTLRKRSQGE